MAETKKDTKKEDTKVEKPKETKVEAPKDLKTEKPKEIKVEASKKIESQKSKEVKPATNYDSKVESKKPEKPDYLKNINMYLGGAMALYAQQKYKELTPYALMKLSEDLNAKSDTESDLVKRLLANGKGLEEMLSIYPDKYNKELGKLKLSEFGETYSPDTISKYASKEDAETIKSALGKYSDKTVGEIQTELGKLEYKLEGHEKGYAKLEEKDLESYKKMAEQYSLLNNYVSVVQSMYLGDNLDKLKPKYYKKSLEGLAKDLKANLN